MADIYLYWKQYDLAIANYKSSLKSEYKKGAEIKLAKAYFNNKNYQESIDLYQALLKKELSFEQNLEALEGLGDTYKATAAFAKAIEQYKKAERIAKLKKKQEKAKAKRLAKERENKKNNFKYSSRNFKTQFNLLYTQFSQVCDNVKREFNSGDFKSRTKKNTYFFISRDSNGKDCHYEWSSNEGNALRRCKQNNETDGKCTIYALGDDIVWGKPLLYKELTGRD